MAEQTSSSDADQRKAKGSEGDAPPEGAGKAGSLAQLGRA
jgi:hypothetical protein